VPPGEGRLDTGRPKEGPRDYEDGEVKGKL
jgi:hypothetical protein